MLTAHVTVVKFEDSIRCYRDRLLGPEYQHQRLLHDSESEFACGSERTAPMPAADPAFTANPPKDNVPKVYERICKTL
jgi:hypothetical protein